MWNYKKYILSISLIFLVGCQFKPEVLFENINVGDNLEVCLAKGFVQHNTNDENLFELRNNNIANTYFTNSEVKFDEKSTVKEIKLKFHESKKGKTAKEVFNFMTQYFCQRYQGMKTRTINEDKVDKNYNAYEVKFRKGGISNIWETNRIKITLKSYDNTLLNRYNVHNYYNSESFDALGYLTWLDIDSKEGKWVELNISVK